MKFPAVVTCLTLFSVTLVDPAFGRAHRPFQVPHGTTWECGACHVRTEGSGPRNPFGQMIEAGFLSEAGYEGDVVWGAELAALDADGDGFTNGEELQDPEGSWRLGDPQPGDPVAVTHPGDPDSQPPDLATAVESTSWGAIKFLVNSLFR